MLSERDEKVPPVPNCQGLGKAQLLPKSDVDFLHLLPNQIPTPMLQWDTGNLCTRCSKLEVYIKKDFRKARPLLLSAPSRNSPSLWRGRRPGRAGPWPRPVPPLCRCGPIKPPPAAALGRPLCSCRRPRCPGCWPPAASARCRGAPVGAGPEG